MLPFSIDLLNRDRASRTRGSSANAMHPLARPRNAAGVDTGRVLFYHSSYAGNLFSIGALGAPASAPHLKLNHDVKYNLKSSLQSLFEESFGFLPITQAVQTSSVSQIDVASFTAASEASDFITARIEDSLIGVKSVDMPEAIKAAAARELEANFTNLLALKETFLSRRVDPSILDLLKQGLDSRGYGGAVQDIGRQAKEAFDAGVATNTHPSIIHAGTIRSGMERISRGISGYLRPDEEFLAGTPLREVYKSFQIPDLVTHIYSIPIDSTILHPEIFRDEAEPFVTPRHLFRSIEEAKEIEYEARTINWATADDLKMLEEKSYDLGLEARRNRSVLLYDGIEVERGMTERRFRISGKAAADDGRIFAYRNAVEDPGSISIMFDKHLVGDDKPIRYLGAVNAVDLFEKELEEKYREDLPRIRAGISTKKEEEEIAEAIAKGKAGYQKFKEAKLAAQKSGTVSGRTLSGILDSGEVAARVMRPLF